MKIQPLADRILIELAPAEEKTSSGIIIPTGAQEKTTQGKVVAIGTCEKIKVKVGQTVMYEKYAGTPIKIDNADHIIVAQKDILAIIEA